MREALAVQSFSEALKAVTLVDNPTEYAMLQNNLGNALQYAASGHPVENNLRALQAYDEALKVRNPRDTPAEYANTIANRANCLRNLPDDPQRPGSANQLRLRESRQLYREAIQIFRSVGELGKVAAVAEALGEVERELGLDADGAAGEPAFGEARI
jgi:tetratricopeptide (TPR) repeat protein